MKVGDIVMCINDNFPHKDKASLQGIRWPVRERIYTIRGFIETDLGVGVILEEIVNPLIPYKGQMLEVNFAIYRFRKLHLDDDNLTIEIHELLSETCDI